MTLLLLSGCSRTWCRQLNGGLVACGDFMCQWISLYVLSRHHWHPFQIHKSRSNFNRFEMTWTMFRLPKFKINFNFGVLKNVPSRGIWSDIGHHPMVISQRPFGFAPPTDISRPSCGKTSGRQLSHHSSLSCSVAACRSCFMFHGWISDVFHKTSDLWFWI